MAAIRSFSIIPYSIPMIRPFTVNGEVMANRDGVIFEVYDQDGHCGRGEAAPLPGVSPEPLKKVIHQLKCLELDWAGRSLPDKSNIICVRLQKDLDRTLLAPSVVFAFESAILSLAANALNVSLVEFLGGLLPKAVRSACLIQGDVNSVRSSGALYAAEGYTVFKLKVGSKNIPLDVSKVEALREVIGFEGRIRLDANGSWPLSEAVSFAGAIGKSQIDFIEEPCADENENEEFFRRTDMNWAMEAHATRRPLVDWEGVQGLKAVVVKPMLYGGVSGFAEVKDIIGRIGADMIVSSCFESRAGLKILANLAAMTNAPCGLGTADWLDAASSSLLGKGGIILPSDYANT
ncbi:MAG: o-succinylbenzoate synthase [Candidatus Omnitrophica bacterium]|nr:o-succinylbenzoate synthase [Candidatus Omnitrophota bacterium]